VPPGVGAGYTVAVEARRLMGTAWNFNFAYLPPEVNSVEPVRLPGTRPLVLCPLLFGWLAALDQWHAALCLCSIFFSADCDPDCWDHDNHPRAEFRSRRRPCPRPSQRGFRWAICVYRIVLERQ
jgi:hypothetical protein